MVDEAAFTELEDDVSEDDDDDGGHGEDRTRLDEEETLTILQLLILGFKVCLDWPGAVVGDVGFDAAELGLASFADFAVPLLCFQQ